MRILNHLEAITLTTIHSHASLCNLIPEKDTEVNYYVLKNWIPLLILSLDSFVIKGI